MFARRAIFAVLISLGVAAPALAADPPAFAMQRAISMDQWVTWPEPSRWNEAKIIGNFPEWQAFVRDAELAQLKAAGLDTIRLPIEPAMFLYSDDARRTATLYAGMKAAIDRLLDADFKVIVDMHTISRDTSGDANLVDIARILNDDTAFARYTGFLSQMARQLEPYSPRQVALEVINEPTSDCRNTRQSAAWQAQLKTLHSAARSANADITLLLTGNCWGSASGLAALDGSQFTDPNTLWVFHSYEPFILTHQGAGWAGDQVKHLAGLPYPPHAVGEAELGKIARENAQRIAYKMTIKEGTAAAVAFKGALAQISTQDRLDATLREPFETAARWADQAGIARERVMLGEFGMIRQEYGKDFVTPQNWRANYMNDMINLAQEFGFGWSLWSFGGAFGMLQGFNGDPLDGDILSELALD